MIKKVAPKQGQESVWDYPRPPRLEHFAGHVRILHGAIILADSNRVIKFMETSHPPSYYIPIDDFEAGVLRENSHRTYCEFKGMASYLDLVVNGKVVPRVGWTYPDPTNQYQILKDHVAIYASKVETCLVNDEVVQAQPGDFYGGWITSNIVGPFKGGPGTMGW